MPLLVRTPEQIMREEPNKDLFYIEFNDLEQVSDPNDPPGRIELIEWFSTYLPNIKIEFLAPSEKSGYIIGGINGRTRVDFDAITLKIFTDAWENIDGSSKDSRFQAYRIPYKKYFSL